MVNIVQILRCRVEEEEKKGEYDCERASDLLWKIRKQFYEMPGMGKYLPFPEILNAIKRGVYEYQPTSDLISGTRLPISLNLSEVRDLVLKNEKMFELASRQKDPLHKCLKQDRSKEGKIVDEGE